MGKATRAITNMLRTWVTPSLVADLEKAYEVALNDWAIGLDTGNINRATHSAVRIGFIEEDLKQLDRKVSTHLHRRMMVLYNKGKADEVTMLAQGRAMYEAYAPLAGDRPLFNLSYSQLFQS